jgi:hypothetical protein
MKSLSTSCLLLFISVTAHQAAADPWGSGGCTEAEKMCGATYVTNPLANQWWRKLGPPSTPTAWTGPSDTVSGHPPATYQVLWRKGASAGTPRDFQVLHTLGGTFYFRAKTTPPADPATFGYTQQDFAVADKLATEFPDIAGLFPEGAIVKSCARDGFSHYLIRGAKSPMTFIVTIPATLAHVTPVPDLKANVAMVPATVAGKPLESVLDNLDYYTLGGQFEMLEAAATYTYLNQPPDGTPTRNFAHIVRDMRPLCPEFPKVTAMGIIYPDSWNKAVGTPTT